MISGRLRTRWAHPRSRGENCAWCMLWASRGGSSPLTRGKRLAVAVGTARGRLIPAHAGKTVDDAVIRKEDQAHPRSRGENFRGLKKQIASEGSSPLTRGKRGVLDGRIGGGGLIPAHAGKTREATRPFSTAAAHPRSRGENTLPHQSVFAKKGSSPLTRGKRARERVEGFEDGLIPAHAGKTLPDLRLYRADRSDLGKP